MIPARSAAQNGWIKKFSLIRPTARRKIAPAPALTNINTMGRKCSMPKITDSATAPAAAAIANSHIDAARVGGNLRAQLGVRILGFKLKLSPTRDDSGAQPKPPSETLSRANGLIGRLAVGEKHLCKI